MGLVEYSKKLPNEEVVNEAKNYIISRLANDISDSKDEEYKIKRFLLEIEYNKRINFDKYKYMLFFPYPKELLRRKDHLGKNYIKILKKLKRLNIIISSCYFNLGNNRTCKGYALFFPNIMKNSEIERNIMLYHFNNGNGVKTNRSKDMVKKTIEINGHKYFIPEIIKKSIDSIKPKYVNYKNPKIESYIKDNFTTAKDRFNEYFPEYNNVNLHVFATKNPSGRIESDIEIIRGLIPYSLSEDNLPSGKKVPKDFFDISQTDELNERKRIVACYKGEYKPQTGGRITEIDGLQRASRVLKYLMLEGRGYYNYDMKSCQLSGLYQISRKLGLDYNLILGYLNQNKKEKAKELKVDKDTLKICLYATIMGADIKNRRGTIYQTVEDYVYKGREYLLEKQKHKEEVEKKYQRMVKYLYPIYEIREEVLDNILFQGGTFDNLGLVTHNKKHLLRNNLGMIYRPHALSKNKEWLKLRGRNVYEPMKNKNEIKKARRRMMSFILTGLESFFIHTLTLLCDTNGINVVGNEHDGIITDAKIPKWIKSEAREKTNFKAARIRIKPICSKKELKEWNVKE